MPRSTNQKALITQTALELFAYHGYKGATVDMITTSAKVSHGLMYNYFRSKEDLLEEILGQAFEDIRASMVSYDSIKDPRKAIDEHIRSTCRIIKDRSNFWRLLHSIRLQEGVPGVMMAGYREIVRHVTSIFEKVFQQLKFEKPHLEAMLFLSQIDGMVIMYLQDDHTPIDDLATQLIKRYNP